MNEILLFGNTVITVAFTIMATSNAWWAHIIRISIGALAFLNVVNVCKYFGWL